MSGGTMNFNFGSDRPSNNGTRYHRQIEPFSMVPFPPDPDFVDRPEILGWLREQLTGVGRRAGLGLGEGGKSQLAIQFAHSIDDASPQTFVFWVHASSRTQFEKTYRDIADRLQLPDRSDPNANVLMLVSNWLRDKANGQWLMVLDNVDHADIFYPSRKRRLDEANIDMPTSLAIYIPHNTGSVLVMSRNRDAAAGLVGYNRIKEVLAMDEGEGLQLLRKKLCPPPLEESAAKLLVALDHIPLAITQAAAYINRSVRMSVTEYLDDFDRNSKKRERLLNWDLCDLRRDESASNSILTTWQMSFEQIRQERPSAAELLSLMSFFNSQGISEWMLRKFRKTSAGAATSGDSDEDDDDEDSKFDEDINTLWAYSLISATAENKTYEMHRLVQFCMRAWLSSFGEIDQWYHRYVVLMAQVVDVLNHGNRAKCQQLLPHVELLFDNAPAMETLPAWTNVLGGSVIYLATLGHFTAARQVAEKMLSVTEKALGFNDETTLNIVATLMRVIVSQDRLQEAEKLGQRVLQECKEPGKLNPPIMRITAILAVVMQKHGKYDESKELAERVIEAHKEERDPHMVGRLACVLEDLGQLEEAEKLFREAIKGYKEQLEERHISMRWYKTCLARVLAKQDQWIEVEKFLRQTVEEHKEQLGEHHFDTLEAISNLATAVESQGRLIEAEKLYWQAVEGLKELGENDFRTVHAMTSLASMLLTQRRYEEAAKLMREIWERHKDMDEHSIDTSQSAYILATLLQNFGQYKEATELYQQAYTGYMVQCGSQDPRTIVCYEMLAVLQNKVQQAGSSEGTVSTERTQDISLE